ncbi:MAG: asparagine synthase-related protein, partial [Candidatus Aenigmatarchaeota archaeon]
EDRILFGSDPKFILFHPAFEIEPDFNAINETLTMGAPVDSGTLFKGIKRISSGNLLNIKNNEVKRKTYWFPNLGRKRSLDKNRLLKLMVNSVKRLTSDMERIGVALSGGIDSSLLVDIISRETETKISTYNIKYPWEKIDESAFARRIADKYNTDHHQLEIDHKNYDNFGKYVWQYPNDPTPFQLVLKTKKARPLTSDDLMLMEGMGADELFDVPNPLLFAQKIKNAKRLLPSQILKFLNFALPNKFKTMELMKTENRMGEVATLFHFSDIFERRRIYSHKFKDSSEKYGNLENIKDQICRFNNLADKRSYVLLKSFTLNHILGNNYFLGDRNSFLYPYFDTDVMNYSYNIRLEDKINKKPIRRISRDRLPKYLIDRDKMSFGYCIQMMVDDSWPLVDNYVRKLSEREFFSERGINKMLKNRSKAGFDHRRSLNNEVLDFLVGLEIWFETFIDGNEPKPLKSI